MSDAWIGVVGAAIGASALLVAQFMTQRHEDSRRFEADRRELYARLIVSCDTVQKAASGCHVERETRPHGAKGRD